MLPRLDAIFFKHFLSLKKTLFHKCLVHHKKTHNIDAAVAQNKGCQMVYFQTKNHYLGNFWRVLQWKMLVYFTAIWPILQQFRIFCDHLAYFMVIWYSFPVLVCSTDKNLATLLKTL
jgi:hypothetical protein